MTTRTHLGPRRPLNWPDTLVDRAAFRFRTNLATRSVFGRRLGSELRVFENGSRIARELGPAPILGRLEADG